MADTISNLSPDVRKSIDDRVKAATAMESNADNAIKAGQLEPYAPKYIPFGQGMEQDAIQRKANKALYGKLGDMQALQKAQHIPKTFGKRLAAHNQGVGVYKFDLARKDALEKIKAEREAQRAALMGSVLGLIGTAVGAYFGGPAGAAAGGAAGSKAGQEMGGT